MEKIEYNLEMDKIAFEFLSEQNSIYALAGMLKTTRQTVDLWREVHESFGEAVQRGVAVSLQKDLAILKQKALNGEYSDFDKYLSKMHQDILGDKKEITHKIESLDSLVANSYHQNDESKKNKNA